MPRREAKRRRRDTLTTSAGDYLELLRKLHHLTDTHASDEAWEAERAMFLRVYVAGRPMNREGIATSEAHRLFDVFKRSPHLLPGLPPTNARTEDVDA